MNKFVCLKCSGSELIYEKWVKCREKVIIQPTGHIEYFDQDINDADVLPVECRFICGSCGQPPKLHGECIVTEAELQDFLKMTPDQRTEMQAEFEALEQEKAQSEEQCLAAEETYSAEAENLKEIEK